MTPAACLDKQRLLSNYALSVHTFYLRVLDMIAEPTIDFLVGFRASEESRYETTIAREELTDHIRTHGC